jgi:hypothetical protein
VKDLRERLFVPALPRFARRFDYVLVAAKQLRYETSTVILPFSPV